MATTPLRNVRVDDDLWAAALRSTAANGTSVSAVVVDALERYVKRYPQPADRLPTLEELTPEHFDGVDTRPRSEPGFWQGASPPPIRRP